MNSGPFLGTILQILQVNPEDMASKNSFLTSNSILRLEAAILFRTFEITEKYLNLPKS